MLGQRSKEEEEGKNCGEREGTKIETKKDKQRGGEKIEFEMYHSTCTSKNRKKILVDGMKQL